MLYRVEHEKKFHDIGPWYVADYKRVISPQRLAPPVIMIYTLRDKFLALAGSSLSAVNQPHSLRYTHYRARRTISCA